MHKVSCMLNLTYDDDHLPEHGQLWKSDLQRFFKRLRKNTGPFRYVAAGEYGDESRRPHFHIALFGMDFASDRKRYGGKPGALTYRSAEVARSWSLGNHLICTLNFDTAAYIARYIMKKIKGPNASPLPLHVDSDTGEVTLPNPEFLIMSKGIGKSWFRDYFMTDVFPTASVITSQGKRAPVPRYYKTLLKEVGSDEALRMSFVSAMRSEFDQERSQAENQPHRKDARRLAFEGKMKSSKRKL